MISLLSFLLVIAICVIAHEGGHYFAARWCDIQVHEFAFGMGPSLFSRKKGETLWSFRLFPVGGFVRLAGMEEEREGEEIVDERRTFPLKTPFQRFIVLASGASVNLFLAFFLTALLLWGKGVADLDSTKIGSLMEGFPAQSLGLEAGDEILAINGETLKNWNTLSALLQKEAAKGPIDLDVRRGESQFSIHASIPVDAAHGVPLLGIRPPVILYPFHKALLRAFSYVWHLGVDIIRGIVSWIFGHTDVTMTGPVGIAGMAGEAVRQGFWSFLSFLAVINLHLGILNLIPFPALDGGRIVFVLGEMILGRKMSSKWENAIHLAGFVVLIGLILLVTWSDLWKLAKTP
ncbi:site-2 protease family protein [Aminithiophilus ramosus]|uniref:Site-2 protease family protein n=2 Tax=Synergistales TaxID=649776 RepID=A0A9Q7AGQ4_9BACT|nr:M50 family metallopeptidase [Aminithiophilus ramosus]QTX33719.1 site-2 protease family protein [Aminithiophilus ramosus]QVL37615.1 site-2 protease family protein [Synergistota bacterium]